MRTCPRWFRNASVKLQIYSSIFRRAKKISESCPNLLQPNRVVKIYWMIQDSTMNPSERTKSPGPKASNVNHSRSVNVRSPWILALSVISMSRFKSSLRLRALLPPPSPLPCCCCCCCCCCIICCCCCCWPPPLARGWRACSRFPKVSSSDHVEVSRELRGGRLVRGLARLRGASSVVLCFCAGFSSTWASDWYSSSDAPLSWLACCLAGNQSGSRWERRAETYIFGCHFDGRRAK